MKITESFLICKGLPFDKVLSEEKIVDIFSKHNNLFATKGIYSTAADLSSCPPIVCDRMYRKPSVLGESQNKILKTLSAHMPGIYDISEQKIW